MRRVVEQQLSQIGDLIRWIAAEKVAGAKKFPTDKIISSVGNGKGIEILIMKFFHVSL
jgi:hypothetical protein